MDKPLKLIVEALLFASDRPITSREIQSWLPGEDSSHISSALKDLKAEYDSLNRSFVLKEVAEGYQFRTESAYAPYILRMMKTSPARLSRAALETLAIIAYRQPVLRQEIERLRGVDVGGIIKTLLEKDLIRIMGRKALPGRPLIYGTTKKFLEVFDLKDLDSLPKLREIRALGVAQEQLAQARETEQEVEIPGKENAAHGENEASGENGRPNTPEPQENT